ncbi:MAG: aldo/keto reductase [Candidatus Rokubacteria bacterium]|nr:aldo/keto reductase [Candidatus Rokubacteria bacterium]
MIPGRATADGTARYVARVGAALPPEHYRPLVGAVRASSIGLGTYLGREDDATDSLYRRAVAGAVTRGLNLIDTAVNYRHQRSERAIGAALAELIGRKELQRDEVIVATKGGYIPFDGDMPADPRAYFTNTYLKPGIITPDEVVGGAHCMAPKFLEDQIERSRKNLGLATIDVYYIHNPEGQLEDVAREDFVTRLRDGFTALEAAVKAGKLARYGVATWNGFREAPSAQGYLSLDVLVKLAREVGGDDHHFRVIQLPYNLAMPEAFTQPNQKVGKEMLTPVAAAQKLGVYVMASASIYQGQLARNLPSVIAEYLPGLGTDAQRALQFVRSTPGIGTALVGMKTPPHVEENAKVAEAAPMPWEQFKRLFSAA